MIYVFHFHLSRKDMKYKKKTFLMAISKSIAKPKWQTSELSPGKLFPHNDSDHHTLLPYSYYKLFP